MCVCVCLCVVCVCVCVGGWVYAHARACVYVYVRVCVLHSSSMLLSLLDDNIAHTQNIVVETLQEPQDSRLVYVHTQENFF